MKTEREIAQARLTIANLEMRLHQGDASPQQKAWVMGARSAFSWALGMTKGSRMIDTILNEAAIQAAVGPFVNDDFWKGANFFNLTPRSSDGDDAKVESGGDG